MKLVVIGTGYVGLVTGTCLAEVGHHVTCIDIDIDKIERLKKGNIDIYEPGLDALVTANVNNQQLNFSTDLNVSLAEADAVFIAVGTPPNEDGSTDLSHVLKVAEDIGRTLNHPVLVIIKSTVPVGTCEKVKNVVNNMLQSQEKSFSIEVVSNPEFLKEGSAVRDFTRPDRIIVGCESMQAAKVMHDIYAPYNRKTDRVIVMDVVSSELTKYAANAMLATKISFINEIANIAESVGADIEHIRKGIGSDPRIGYEFIYAGCGYGGSCFPKDVKSLARVANDTGCQSHLLDAVDSVNEHQKTILFRHLSRHFSGKLQGKTIAVWGLAFKPETNDIREAPSLVLLEALWQAGAYVKAFDPVAMPEIATLYKHIDKQHLMFCENKEQVLTDADALVICTEWKAFKVFDFVAAKKLLKTPVIIDGRNLYDPVQMRENKFDYYGVGRGESCLNASSEERYKLKQ